MLASPKGWRLPGSVPLLRPSAHGMTLQGGCSKVLTGSQLPAGTVPTARVCGVGGTVP